MQNLKTILQEAASDQRLLLGTPSTNLLQSLRDYRRQQFIIFVAAQLFVIVALIVCIYFLASHPRETDLVKVFSGLIGVGAGGAIEIMRRIWKEWSQTELLLLLIPDASPQQMQELINKLIEKM